MKNEQDKGIEQEPIKEANIELEEYKRLAEERFDKLKYLQADFDNYRKKFDKEKESIIRLANENLIQELIVILDDFESSIRLTESDKNKEGSLIMKKKFLNLLQKHGLKEIESLGKKFDPNFHDVLCKELSEHDDDVVIEEIQKGYILCSKVIRPAKVKISKRDNSQNLKRDDLK
ncbi:MAG: nucleotide exchange factor GrpE [archaeon]|nr:nucleotide exchange factor GrpE [archaeon]